MCPESNAHGKIKETVLQKLKELYGAGLKEYPHGGQINDVYVVTPNQGDIFVENIWTSTKNNFQRDLNILHRSPANVKILIVNPKIIESEKLCREYEKTRMSETSRGIAISEMINGTRILSEPKFVDEEFPKIIKKLVRESLSRISVTPNTIFFGVGNWQSQSMFKVHNRTDEVFYQIWVKLIIDGINVAIKDIEVEMVRQKEEVKARVGKIELNLNMLGWRGIDQTGNNAILLLISDLNPKDTLSFVVRNINTEPSSILTQTKATISIVGLSQKSTTILSQKGKVAMGFVAPENFIIKGIKFRVNAISEPF